MSLGGYADERDDVGKLGWRGRFGWIFGRAVWLEYIIRTGSWCEACKIAIAPHISSFKV